MVFLLGKCGGYVGGLAGAFGEFKTLRDTEGWRGGTTGKGGVGELRTCGIKVFKVGHMKNSLPLYDFSILHICQLHHRIIRTPKKDINARQNRQNGPKKANILRSLWPKSTLS